MNAILAFIGAASLSDDEFNALTIEDQVYTEEVYLALIGVLDARESVTSTRDRLTHYFQARGVEVTAPSAAKSNILVGGVLCD